MLKIDGLDELRRWVLNTNGVLRSQGSAVFPCQIVNYVMGLVHSVAASIRDEYPFYADKLPGVSKTVFIPLGGGLHQLNAASFGELFIVVEHLYSEPLDASIWKKVHPRIARIAKGLYEDGHYLEAANRSIVELEAGLREAFEKLKPDTVMPSKVGDLIGGLLSEHGAYWFGDASTQSEKDYRRGVRLLFEGAFAAYRNPSSHGNPALSKDSSFDQIVLASQLMKVLDDR